MRRYFRLRYHQQLSVPGPQAQEHGLQKSCQSGGSLFPQLCDTVLGNGRDTPGSSSASRQAVERSQVREDGFSPLEAHEKTVATFCIFFCIFLVSFLLNGRLEKIIKFKYLKCLSLYLFSVQELYPEDNILLCYSSTNPDVFICLFKAVTLHLY